LTSPLRQTRDGLLLSVRVTPKSSRDQVAGLYSAADGSVSLAVKVTAPPDKGKANKAVIEVIAKAARVAKSSFRIVAGETDRSKTILVTGNQTAVQAWITALKDEGESS
jgi:uncharacterized protein (TIGR00251 family)